MKSTTIEIAHFRLKLGVQDAEFQRLIALTNTALSSYPGFISRTLGKTCDGEHFDIVKWETLETAQAAAASFIKDERAESFMAALDFSWEGNWLKHLSTVNTFP